MQEHTHQHTEEEQPEVSVEQLKSWLEHFARSYQNASARKDRLVDLMGRKKTKKWSPEKTAKMVRRLVAANKEIEQAENALDQVQHRLSQAGIEVEIKSRSEGLTNHT